MHIMVLGILHNITDIVSICTYRYCHCSNP